MIRALFLVVLMIAPAWAETRVEGLSAPIDIVTDLHGIPHVTAQTIPDAFFGQGYVQATQRLWQIDLSHRRKLGQLAAAFGPAFVKFDSAARTMLFRGDLAAEWRTMDPRVAPILRAFVAGVNARVREVRADPALLPPEFVALGILPEEWTADDVLRTRYQSGLNVAAELRRARLACAGALDADGIMQKLEPDWSLAVPQGLDPCLLREDDLELYHRLSGPLPFSQAVRHAALDVADPDASDGSNAWVISPRLSATGRAVLANDPHLPFSVPGPRFLVHLRAPGFDSIGAGPAGRPGFMFGHNERVAFGRTNFNIDQEDLYVLTLNDDGTAYRAPGGWEKITRVAETIDVRNAAPVSVVVGLTPLGPVISERSGHAIVLRSASLQPGPPAALEYVLLSLAKDWPSFRYAIASAVSGSNYMYADVDGNIGWQAGGRVPRRRQHDGLMPVPAEGGFDWDGVVPVSELPNAFNPDRGWIASANQMPFAPDYPIAERRVGFEWVSDDRYRRIAEVLGSDTHHSLADSVALQHDTVSMRAAALRPLLDRITARDLAGPVAMLRGWDGRVEADSKAAALYEFWSTGLQAAMAARLIPSAAKGLVSTAHAHLVRDLLLSPDARLGGDPVATRDAMLTRALRDAEARRAGRSWGAIHTVVLRHPLAAMMPRLSADISGLGSGGDGTTVMARWWPGIANSNTTGGAMFAAVVDVGQWDDTLAIIAPGQSGDPRDPHYADLYRPWLEGRYFSLPYGQSAIDAVVESRLRLVP